MLMSTQHMVNSNDYRFTPVGGRVCKETDLGVMKATIWLRIEPLSLFMQYEEKLHVPAHIH